MPVFSFYVRSEGGYMWYPCGNSVGDARSKTMVESWMSNTMGMGNMMKKNIDRSIAASMYTGENAKDMKRQIRQMYPDFKKSKREMVFGYKVEYEGLEEVVGEQEIQVITEDMTKQEGFFNRIKNMFSSS